MAPFIIDGFLAAKAYAPLNRTGPRGKITELPNFALQNLKAKRTLAKKIEFEIAK
jgi:hypothetical protein